MKQPPDRRALGAAGEALAAAWYERRGFTVLDRNWRCRDGELDLVVADATTIVFCEVKTRRSTRFGAPIEAVTAAKARRVRLLAAQWLAGRRERKQVRFDVASVTAHPQGDFTVEVLESAF